MCLQSENIYEWCGGWIGGWYLMFFRLQHINSGGGIFIAKSFIKHFFIIVFLCVVAAAVFFVHKCMIFNCVPILIIFHLQKALVMKHM